MSLLRKRNLFPSSSFFEDFFNPDWAILDLGNDSNGFGSKWMPAANIKEEEKEFVVELSVPGYAKKDIHIDVTENNVLQITGEHEEESKEETDSYTRKEFSRGSFARSFQLPESVNTDKITAKCNEGVLVIQLPKKKTAILKKKVKEIAIA